MKIPLPGEKAMVAANTRPQDVAYIMAALCRQLASSDELTQDLAQFVKTDPEQNWPAMVQYIYQNSYFVPDPPSTQIISTPRAIFREEAANCVDYTVILGAIAISAGMPVTIRCVKFSPITDYVHVYPVINGQAVDLVIGQRQDGSEKNQRRNIYYDHFGEEVDYYAKFDVPI
jgi:hypothetical protein